VSEFEDPAKQAAWASYWEGYKHGKSVESYNAVQRRTALSRFERWWRLNHEES